MNDLSVGDISGYKKAFDALIKKSNFNRIIGMGDIIDRGPNSAEMIQFFLDNPNHQCLMGNHEHMMIKVYENVMLGTPTPYLPILWIYVNGGKQTLESYGIEVFGKGPSYEELKKMTLHEKRALSETEEFKFVFDQFSKIPKDHINYLKSMPLFIETETHVYTHAPVSQWKNPKVFNYKAFDESDYMLDTGCLWNRRDPNKPRKDNKILVYGHQNKKNVLCHTNRFPNGKYLENSQNKIYEETWAICIDTVKAGFLSSLESETGLIHREKI